MPEISITTPHRSLRAHLRTPSGEGPWPGVVILHDALGQPDASLEQAE